MSEIEEMEKVKIEFDAVFLEMIQEIKTEPMFSDIPHVIEYLEQLMNTAAEGKHYRAFLGIYMFRAIKPDATKEEQRLCYISAWNQEFIQTSALMIDDVMDNAQTRRGHEAYYRKFGPAQTMIDSALLENIVYYFYFKYMADKSYLFTFLKKFRMNLLKTTLGQCLDSRPPTMENALPIDKEFTMKKYEAIVLYKTSFYTFTNPIIAALVMGGMMDEDILAEVEEVTIKLGFLFQVQDDILDCHGDPKITGKIGTDIKDNKCTWLIVKALEMASDGQKEVLMEYYGSNKIEADLKVKQIYEELELEELFRNYEKKMVGQIKNSIDHLPKQIPKKPFTKLLYAMYRRDK